MRRFESMAVGVGGEDGGDGSGSGSGGAGGGGGGGDAGAHTSHIDGRVLIKQLDSPSGVAVGMDSVIYVADFGQHRIQCFDSNGTFIRKWGTEGTHNAQFHHPTGVTTACHGIKDSIMMAVSRIPELYAFPPGVLPI